MSKVLLDQKSQDWIKWRNSIIGASDSPIILGKSPYKTKRKLWEEKVGLSESETSESMKIGNEREPIIREMVNERLGTKYEPECHLSNQYNWLGASLDGVYQNSFLEIKVNKEETHSQVKKGQIPEAHLIQMNHQSIVLQNQKGIYASFNITSQDLCIVDFNANMGLVDPIINETQRFWQLVRDFEAPELEARDFEDRNDPELFLRAKEIIEMQEQCKGLEKRIKELKDGLVTEVGSKTNVRIGDYKLMRQERKGAVDYSKIQALKTIDLEQYRKAPTSFWVLK